MALLRACVERFLQVRPFERLQQIAAEDQRHQLGRGERKSGHFETIDEPPARPPVRPFRVDREMEFERLEVAANCPRIAGMVQRQRRDKLIQSRAARAFQLRQQKPLASNLVVARHRRLPPGANQPDRSPGQLRVGKGNGPKIAQQKTNIK